MKINTEIFNMVTEKASLFSSKDKGYLISFTSIRTSAGDYIAKLIAGNGQAQSSVVFPYSADEPCREPLCLAPTLKDAVAAVSKSTESFELEKKGGVAVLSSKNVRINIPLLTCYEQILPPDDELLSCEVNRKEFLAALKQGGVSVTDAERQYNSCIMLRPRYDGEDLYLSFFSVSSTGRSCAHIKVRAKDPDSWIAKSNEKKTYLIPHTDISRISPALQRENTILYLGDRCLLVRDGNDLFSFVTYEQQPSQDFIPFFNYSQVPYRAKITVSAFVSALNAASIGMDPNSPRVTLLVQEKEITVTSETGNSAGAGLTENSNGAWSGVFNPLQLRSILRSIGSDEVTIYSAGDEARPVIYVTADNIAAVSIATGFLR